jgi:hypothetical protein
MTLVLTTPDRSSFDDDLVVLHDPGPGTVVELGAGARLCVRFRTRLGASRWHAAAVPGHLVELVGDGGELVFLVFGSASAGEPLRLERRHPQHGIVHEVCELLVVPVSRGGVRTSTSA